jgi:hypothetical protein
MTIIIIIIIIIIMLKVKLSLHVTEHHAMKGEWRYSCTHSLISALDGVVSFTPRPIYPQGKSPRCPLNRRLGGPQSRSGRSGEEKNYQPPPGIEL